MATPCHAAAWHSVATAHSTPCHAACHAVSCRVAELDDYIPTPPTHRIIVDSRPETAAEPLKHESESSHGSTDM